MLLSLEATFCSFAFRNHVMCLRCLHVYVCQQLLCLLCPSRSASCKTRIHSFMQGASLLPLRLHTSQPSSPAFFSTALRQDVFPSSCPSHPTRLHPSDLGILGMGGDIWTVSRI